MLLGALYGGRDQTEEAVVAWDTAMDRYREGRFHARRALALDQRLHAAQREQRRAIWDQALQRARPRCSASNFPSTRTRARVTLLEGQRTRGRGQLPRRRADLREDLEGQPRFEEAQFRAGTAYVGHAPQAREATARPPRRRRSTLKAEEILRRAMADAERRDQEEPRPRREAARWSASTSRARVALAGVLLTDGGEQAGRGDRAARGRARRSSPATARSSARSGTYRFHAYKAGGEARGRARASSRPR